MLACDKCGRKLEEKDALVHTKKNHEKEFLCHACFEKETGVDFKTFARRKEMMKWTLFAVSLCSMATFYAFVNREPIHGILGLVLTALVYFFGSSKAK